jgi:hypothetical protein
VQNSRRIKNRFRNVDPGFFAKFPNGRLGNGFLRLDLSSGTVPFSFSKSALIHGEENFSRGIQNENQRGLAHGNS